jgi:hypothetical protein
MIKNPIQRKYWTSAKGAAAKQRQKTRDNANGANKNRRLKNRYGISLADYNALLASQGGACATCRRAVKTFHVDHCHLTGIVRGILCPACNRALGLINENSGTARALAEYLEKRR